MNKLVVLAKDLDAKKGFSSTPSNDEGIHRVRNGPERQLGHLRSVIGAIRRDGGTPSAESIATQLSSMHTTQRAPALLALQQTHGNRYVQRVVSGIQAKLKVGQPGDIYEQEADRVADEVMQMPEPKVQRQAEEEEKKKEEEKLIQTKPLSEQITPLVQRYAEEKEEEEEEILQTKENPGLTPGVIHDLEARIQLLKGGGQPLPEENREFMERRFGIDFSGVRLHADSDAAQMSRELNASAFTYGRDIYFGAGRYSPGKLSGKRLLAHELTHVVQQGKDNSIKREKVKFYNSFCSLNRFINAVDFTIQRACSTTNLDDCSDEDLLTAICIGEAGNIRDRDGKKGVVNVVMNRVADSAFPNTIRSVVTATDQFGGLNQGIRNLTNPSFSDCRGIAREVFNNPTVDPTIGALWFNQSCSKPCYQYCTTYLGDGSSPAHYFARRATTEERRNCRGTRRWPCCHHPRTRISYITFREEEVEPIIVQRKADEYNINSADSNDFPPKSFVPEIKPLIQRSCLEHPNEEYYRNSQNYCKDTGRPLEPGNLAVKRLFKSGVIQEKLKTGQPGDKYEQEADRLAEQVMRMPELQLQQQKHVIQKTSNTTIVPKSYVQLSPTPTGEEERTEQGPLQALSCPCGESTRVNYDSLTFEFIMSLAPTIQPIARSEGIPIDPVAGAIADEYDRRRGYRTIVDGAQDAIIDALPECFIDVDRFFDIQNRLLNTLENDVGPANINVRTALELVRRGELQVPGSPPTNIQVNRIIDFLLTERGTVQATAAVVSRAQRLFGPYLVGYPNYLSESILVEYFKQGDSYYDRFRRTLEATPGHQPCPGDGGCRFIYNRDRIQDTLSRGFIRQAIMEPTLPTV